MANPFEPPPAPGAAGPLAEPARSSRAGCLVTLAVSFLVGFGLVGAFLFLRAPDAADPPAPRPESPLAEVVLPPPGYERLPDATSGGGRLDAAGTARVMSVGRVDGFRDALLRAWGKPRGTSPRAVVVLAVQLDSPESAARLLASFQGYATSPDLEEIAGLPEGWVGFLELDTGGRHAQRVGFAKGDRVFVVSVLTPATEPSTSEVLKLAHRQADA